MEKEKTEPQKTEPEKTEPEETKKELKAEEETAKGQPEEFVRKMGAETKTALIVTLIVIGALLLSTALVYLIGYSNQITNYKRIPNVIVGVIVAVIGGVFAGAIYGVIDGVIVGVFVGVIYGVIGGVFAGVFVGVIYGVVGGVIGGVIGGVVGGKTINISAWNIVLLSFVFFFPFANPWTGLIPISKYHNYKQIERDQRISEILQITVLEKEELVEILLPDQYARENSYLKKCFSFGWEEQKKERWERPVMVPCREDERYWFYARIPFPENKTAKPKLELFFDHAWQDLTLKKVAPLK